MPNQSEEKVALRHDRGAYDAGQRTKRIDERTVRHGTTVARMTQGGAPNESMKER